MSLIYSAGSIWKMADNWPQSSREAWVVLHKLEGGSPFENEE